MAENEQKVIDLLSKYAKSVDPLSSNDFSFMRVSFKVFVEFKVKFYFCLIFSVEKTNKKRMQ